MSAETDDTAMPLMEHLTELRSRLMRALIIVAVLFVAFYFLAREIFLILIKPYQWGAGTDDVVINFFALQEVFFVDIKIAFFSAIFVGFPVIATELYKFIAPGLYRNEKQAFLPFLVATPVLFFLGGCLVYFLIMPLATAFFLSQQQFGSDVTIQNVQGMAAYLGLIMTLIFAFGLAFQLPVLLTLLAQAELVTSEGLKAKWKWAIIITFVFAAVLTPPDPVSQLGLAVPTLLLYQLSIISARLIERKRAAREAAEAEA